MSCGAACPLPPAGGCRLACPPRRQALHRFLWVLVGQARAIAKSLQLLVNCVSTSCSRAHARIHHMSSRPAATMTATSVSSRRFCLSAITCAPTAVEGRGRGHAHGQC